MLVEKFSLIHAELWVSSVQRSLNHVVWALLGENWLEELIDLGNGQCTVGNQPGNIDGRFELALPVLFPVFFHLLDELIIADFADSLQLLTALNRDEQDDCAVFIPRTCIATFLTSGSSDNLMLLYFTSLEYHFESLWRGFCQRDFLQNQAIHETVHVWDF